MSFSTLCSIKNLTFRFEKKGGLFFNDVSCTIRAGQLYFLQGQNGCGKSTFLRLLQGNVQSQEVLTGTLCVHDQVYDLAAGPAQDLLGKMITAVPQHVHVALAMQMTALQNLQLARVAEYPTLGRLPVALQYDDLIRYVDLPLEKNVEQLSGGQRQLLTIMMSLQKSTNILVLDEPTAALDPFNAALVMDFVRTLTTQYAIAVIMVNHNSGQVKQCENAELLQVFIDAETGCRTLRMA